MDKRMITAVLVATILCVGIRITDRKDDAVMTFSDKGTYVPKSITLEDFANELFLRDHSH